MTSWSILYLSLSQASVVHRLESLLFAYRAAKLFERLSHLYWQCSCKRCVVEMPTCAVFFYATAVTAALWGQFILVHLVAISDREQVSIWRGKYGWSQFYLNIKIFQRWWFSVPGFAFLAQTGLDKNKNLLTGEIFHCVGMPFGEYICRV